MPWAREISACLCLSACCSELAVLYHLADGLVCSLLTFKQRLCRKAQMAPPSCVVTSAGPCSCRRSETRVSILSLPCSASPLQNKEERCREHNHPSAIVGGGAVADGLARQRAWKMDLPPPQKAALAPTVAPIISPTATYSRKAAAAHLREPDTNEACPAAFCPSWRSCGHLSKSHHRYPQSRRPGTPSATTPNAMPHPQRREAAQWPPP